MRSARLNMRPGATILSLSYYRLGLLRETDEADEAMDRNSDGRWGRWCRVVGEGQLTSTNKFYHKHHRRR
jgi:hypothetical protein